MKNSSTRKRYNTNSTNERFPFKNHKKDFRFDSLTVNFIIIKSTKVMILKLLLIQWLSLKKLMESAMQRDVHKQIFENGLQKRYRGICILYTRQLKQHCDKWYLCFLFSQLCIARGSDGHLREIYSKPFLFQSRTLVIKTAFQSIK